MKLKPEQRTVMYHFVWLGFPYFLSEAGHYVKANKPDLFYQKVFSLLYGKNFISICSSIEKHGEIL